MSGRSLATVLILTTFATGAHAQGVDRSNGDGFDTHLFRPALDSRGLISVNGVDVLGGGHASFGLVLDYGRGLLRAPDVGQRSTTLIDDSFTGTFHASYGLGGIASVGLSAPVILMSGVEQTRGGAPGATPSVVGWGPRAIDTQTLQHVAVHGKLRLTRADREGVGLALGLQVGAPLTDASRSAGADPSPFYWPSAIFEKRWGVGGAIRVAANVGYRGHGASSTSLTLREGRFQDASRITYSVGGSIRVLDPLDVVLETYGTYLVGGLSSAAVRPSNEALFGVKVFVDRSSYLVLGGGPRLTGGVEAADVRGVIGFIFEPPVGDADGDGVPDDVDRCPNVPGVLATEGCPLDTDDDGVPDVEDACPLVKGVRTADPRTNGCPADRDFDGVPDSEDACPDVPGVRTNNPKTNGCPAAPDRDRDGVPDVEDACPDLPGKRHPDPERNGCPDAYLKEGKIIFFDKILFRTASAEILPESNPILDNIAAVLLEHPELTLVEVAGHADERGSEPLNLTLTQARVDSVMRALGARRVPRPRLRAKGYGLYCPIDDGHDEEAWSKNRRVEIVVIETNGSLTHANPGCPNAEAHGVRP